MGTDISEWVTVLLFLSVFKDFPGDSSGHVGLESLAYS